MYVMIDLGPIQRLRLFDGFMVMLGVIFCASPFLQDVAKWVCTRDIFHQQHV